MRLSTLDRSTKTKFACLICHRRVQKRGADLWRQSRRTQLPGLTREICSFIWLFDRFDVDKSGYLEIVDLKLLIAFLLSTSAPTR